MTRFLVANNYILGSLTLYDLGCTYIDVMSGYTCIHLSHHDGCMDSMTTLHEINKFYQRQKHTCEVERFC
jgi:hypothetical protein